MASQSLLARCLALGRVIHINGEVPNIPLQSDEHLQERERYIDIISDFYNSTLLAMRLGTGKHLNRHELHYLVQF